METTKKQRGMQAFQVFTLGWILLFLTQPVMADPEPLYTQRTAVVAIDPGHGGQDNGATGPTGLLEKKVVLELAHQLALALQADYRVTLTRSGDYDVEPRQRTAIANQVNADLMISLHTGAGFRHTTQGRAIYYHAGSDSDADIDNKIGHTGAQPLWHLTQNRHTQASQRLAKIMKQQFENIPAQAPCQIQSAPLVVLQGADLPAVLIELGHITNPDTEKILTTPEHMKVLVNGLSRGIGLFLQQRTQPVSP